MAVTGVGWAVVALDMIKAAAVLMESGEDMTDEQINALVDRTHKRARETITSIRESLKNDPT